MNMEFYSNEFQLYLELLVRGLRGTRSTLRVTNPTWAQKISELIDMPRRTLDEAQIFLLKAHKTILDGRNAVYRCDPEAFSLFDAIHNVPYGLLGRFDGIWDWKESLLSILQNHEDQYLSGLRKYSGMLKSLELA